MGSFPRVECVAVDLMVYYTVHFFLLLHDGRGKCSTIQYIFPPLTQVGNEHGICERVICPPSFSDWRNSRAETVVVAA